MLPQPGTKIRLVFESDSSSGGTMRHISFSFFLSLCAFAVLSSPAHACNVSAAGDYICESDGDPADGSGSGSGGGSAGSGGASGLPTPPAATATSPKPITRAQGDVPRDSSKPIDYSKATAATRAHVQSNLTQETKKLITGSCTPRSIAAGSTTSIPFVFDGSNSFTVAPGPGPVRTFVSSLPGFDPAKSLNAGGEYYSPCHSVANKPDICYSSGESETCYPDPDNETSLNISTADHAISGAGSYKVTGTVDLRDSTRGAASLQDWLGVKTPAAGGASPFFDVQMSAGMPVHVIIDPAETEVTLLAKLNALPNISASIDHNWVIPDVLDPISGLMVPGPGPAVDIGTGALIIQSADGQSPITIRDGGGTSDGTGGGGLAAGTATLAGFFGSSPTFTQATGGIPPNWNNCPLTLGETYYMNIQNENSSPIDVNIGLGNAGCASTAMASASGGP